MGARNPLGSLCDVISAIVPVDTQTGDNDGDWISLRNWEGVLVVIFKAAGVANDDPIIYVEQATVVAGTDAKVLNGIDWFFSKQGAALTAVGTWTAVQQAVDDHMDGNTSSAEQQLLRVAWIPTDRLDVDGGFDCIRVRITDTGAAGAQLGCALYIPFYPIYATSPDHLVNSLTN